MTPSGQDSNSNDIKGERRRSSAPEGVGEYQKVWKIWWASKKNPIHSEHFMGWEGAHGLVGGGRQSAAAGGSEAGALEGGHRPHTPLVACEAAAGMGGRRRRERWAPATPPTPLPHPLKEDLSPGSGPGRRSRRSTPAPWRRRSPTPAAGAPAAGGGRTRRPSATCGAVICAPGWMVEEECVRGPWDWI